MNDQLQCTDGVPVLCLTSQWEPELSIVLFHCPVAWTDEAELHNRGRGQLYYVLHSACSLTPFVLLCLCLPQDPRLLSFSASPDRQIDRQTDPATRNTHCSLEVSIDPAKPYQGWLPPRSLSVQTPIDPIWQSACSTESFWMQENTLLQYRHMDKN